MIPIKKFVPDGFSYWSGNLCDSHFSSPDVYDDKDLFDMIKMYCWGKPNLLKRVVHQALHIQKFQNPGVPIEVKQKIVKKRTSGRLWVSCMFNNTYGTRVNPGEISPEQDALNNVEGAYQETAKGSGIYQQPKPRIRDPGVQHRLRKEKESWVIDEYDPHTTDWIKRAEEDSGRIQRDLRNPHRHLSVIIIPLTKILQRMMDHNFEVNVEKRLDFLFEVCNQKMLNSNLKKRNLKHNIDCLKAKLEKNRYLIFAIRVRKIADAIAKERETCG